MTQKRTRIAALIACTLIFGASCTLLDSANYCKVSFNTNGGNRIKSQKVKIGETLEKPDDPTRDGYEFDAWYYSKNRFDFSTPITEDITLNAYWTFRKADDTPQDGTPPGDGNSEEETGNGSGNLEEGDGTGDSTPPGGDNPGDETGNGSGNPEEGDGTGDSGNTDKDDENSTVSYDVYAEKVEDFTPDAYGETTYTLRLLGTWTDNALARFREKIADITERSVTLNMAEAKITTIGEETFMGCASLVGVIIGDDVTDIATTAFSGCTALTSVTLGKGWVGKPYKDDGSETALTPFKYCTEVIIGDSVTKIGEYAFYNCTSLESVTIGNNVETIGKCAFYGCQFTSITLPDSVTTIGDIAFFNCKFTSITLPDNVTSIGSQAFESCAALASINIPDKVTSIGSRAFRGCSELKSINIPDSVTTIGNIAFYKCTSLASITIGNGVKSIGENVFEGCTSLTSITIPDRVTNIDKTAFLGCSELTTVTLGADYVGQTFTSSNTANALAPFTSCTDVIIGDNVETIGKCAFFECAKLASVTIGNSVKTIGDNAFYGCKFASITLPDSVTSIGKYAFFDCASLETITFKGTAEQWGKIERGSLWHDGVPAKQVTCTGGDTDEKKGLDWLGL